MGATEQLCLKVDYVVHSVGEEGRSHAIGVYVSEGDEEDVRAFNRMLQDARKEVKEKREPGASATPEE